MSVRKQTYFDGWEKAIHTTNAKLTAEQERAVIKAFNDSMADLIKNISRSRTGMIPNRIYKDYAYDLYKTLDSIIGDYSKKVYWENQQADSEEAKKIERRTRQLKKEWKIDEREKANVL